MTEVRNEATHAATGRRVLTIGPLEAIRRHPVVAVLPLLLLVAGAAALGLLRTATHTAEARLSIGRIDLNTPGALSSFVEASSALAAGYSRAIYANQVIEQVSEEQSIPPDEVRQRIIAGPIPGSAVFRVVAVGPSEASAVGLSNAASSALQDYIEQLNANNPNGGRLLREFRVAAKRSATLQARVQRILSRPELLIDRQALAEAQTRAAVAGLQASTKRRAYEATQQSQSSVSLVQELSTATFATNDRNEQLQLFIFYALAAGGLIGAALATLLANNRARAAVST